MLANRYRLDAVVGRGGMGTVWQAYDVRLDREVAVKEVLLPPGLSPRERDILYERTFREARASARLNHPGVVTVHDVVEENDRPWIVMEFVRARSLQDLIDEGGVSPRRAAEIGRQTLAALQHAHQKGILHRDVKPSNVLITQDGRAVLTDWGIAQAEGDSTLTQTGLVMGSPAYIPPERAQGERAVPASDLWALGATLYAAVEGQSPYERPDAMSSLAAALSEPVPPPRNAGPLRPVLEGLLAREPRFRMTAEQALPRLAEVADTPEEPPARPADPYPTVLDETSLDQPALSFPLPHETPETVLDSEEIEPPTRREYGTHSGVFRGETQQSERGSGNRSDSRPENRSRNVERPSQRSYGVAPTPPPAPPPPPSSEAEAQTVLQTDWSAAPQPPQTPPPFNPWQQVSHLMPEQPAGRQGRSRTLALVVIAVGVLIVAIAAAVLIMQFGG